MGIAKHHYAVKLVGETGSERVEFFFVGGGPPVSEISFLVKLTSLVVEPVGHLMSDYDSDGTVIFSRVGVGVEIRSLKYSGREAYLVA